MLPTFGEVHHHIVRGRGVQLWRSDDMCRSAPQGTTTRPAQLATYRGALLFPVRDELVESVGLEAVAGNDVAPCSK